MSDKIEQFYYKKSRIQQLKGFCYTVQKGNAKLAAEKMGLDPSAVSLQIKALEGDLGVKLFDRQGKRLVLNKKGKAFYEKAIKILQGIDGLFEDFLLEEDKHYQTHLNIAGTSIILSHLLPSYLAKFNKLHPEIKISLHNISKEECKQQILDRKIDLGVYIFLPDEEIETEFEVTNYKRYISYWVMHKNHPLANKPRTSITKEDIAETNFAYIPEGVTMETFKKFLKDYKIKNFINIENGDIELLKKITEENLCVICLPEIYLDKNSSSLTTKDVVKELGYENSYYGLLTKKKCSKTVLLDFITILNI